MKDWSRRNLLRASAGAAIAVPMAALGSSAAAAAPNPTGAGPAPGGSAAPAPAAGVDPQGPVMFCVHDAQRGEVSILHGTTEVIVQDPQLVARIVTAARSSQA